MQLENLCQVSGQPEVVTCHLLTVWFTLMLPGGLGQLLVISMLIAKPIPWSQYTGGHVDANTRWIS